MTLKLGRIKSGNSPASDYHRLITLKYAFSRPKNVRSNALNFVRKRSQSKVFDSRRLHHLTRIFFLLQAELTPASLMRCFLFSMILLSTESVALFPGRDLWLSRFRALILLALPPWASIECLLRFQGPSFVLLPCLFVI